MLTLGDRALNDALGGGIPINGITEIVGEAGLGKTQLGMQLCLNVQLPGSVGGMGKGKTRVPSVSNEVPLPFSST